MLSPNNFFVTDFTSCEVKSDSSVLGISYHYHTVDVLDCGFEGKWIKLGQTGSWNYVDENDASFSFDLISDPDHQMLKDLFLTEKFSVSMLHNFTTETGVIKQFF